MKKYHNISYLLKELKNNGYEVPKNVHESRFNAYPYLDSVLKDLYINKHWQIYEIAQMLKTSYNFVREHLIDAGVELRQWAVKGKKRND